jgi:beta-glucanase (GH16 family)
MLRKILLFSGLSLVSFSAQSENLCSRLKGPAMILRDQAESPRWKLVWSDEFSHNGKTDSSNWGHTIDGNGCGNDEQEYYTDRNAANARIKNGILTITALKEKKEWANYTSARLYSKKTWTYGRFEIRAKMAAGLGTWPAIWMLPTKQTYGEQIWVDNGEIDIAESAGRDPDHVLSSAYTKADNYWTGVQKTHYAEVKNSATEFHTYTFDWLPEVMDFYIDGVKSHSIIREPGSDWTRWPFDQEFYLILNLAMGGGFAGDIEDSSLPARIEIDYVRVYRPLLFRDCFPQNK